MADLKSLANLARAGWRKHGVHPSRFLILDRDDSLQNTVFLSSMPRAGSTWLSDVINAENRLRYIFEPLHPKENPQIEHFGWSKYLRPDNKDPAFLEPMKAILQGKVHSWHCNSLNKTVFPKGRLIKEVRSNLLLKWLHENFPEVRIILLIRNPFANALSLLERGWKAGLNKFTSQPELMEDFLYPYADLLESAKEPFEASVVSWCVENLVPLKQFDRNDILIQHYEAFCVNPMEEARNIFDYLQLDYPPEKVTRAVKRPSATVSRKSAVITGGDPVNRWKNRISDDQILMGRRIMGRFGMDTLYNDEGLPDQEAFTVFVSSADI